MLYYRFAPIDLSELQAFENEVELVHQQSLRSSKGSRKSSAGKMYDLHYHHDLKANHRRLKSQVKTILREQAELETPKAQTLSFDESTTDGVIGRKKATLLMAACHQGLEHNVSKILWRKVSSPLNIFFINSRISFIL